MSTFSPIGLLSSNGMRICVCVCVCGRNELEVCTTLAHPHFSSFCTMPVLCTSTHPQLTGLKVDPDGISFIGLLQKTNELQISLCYHMKRVIAHAKMQMTGRCGIFYWPIKGLRAGKHYQSALWRLHFKKKRLTTLACWQRCMLK